MFFPNSTLSPVKTTVKWTVQPKWSKHCICLKFTLLILSNGCWTERFNKQTKGLRIWDQMASQLLEENTELELERERVTPWVYTHWGKNRRVWMRERAHYSINSGEWKRECMNKNDTVWMWEREEEAKVQWNCRKNSVFAVPEEDGP